MSTLPHVLTVIGVVLAVWAVVPGVALVVVPRIWRRYYERTDVMPTGEADRPRSLTAGTPRDATAQPHPSA